MLIWIGIQRQSSGIWIRTKNCQITPKIDFSGSFGHGNDGIRLISASTKKTKKHHFQKKNTLLFSANFWYFLDFRSDFESGPDPLFTETDPFQHEMDPNHWFSEKRARNVERSGFQIKKKKESGDCSVGINSFGYERYEKVL